jgi:hypothetical protein
LREVAMPNRRPHIGHLIKPHLTINTTAKSRNQTTENANIRGQGNAENPIARPTIAAPISVSALRWRR